jgi:mannose-1-phosphate guanylyltransferase
MKTKTPSTTQASPDDSTHVFILAGGSGERFWPLSRKTKPKQFLSLLGGPSLLQRTVHRAAPLCSQNRLAILTSQALVETTRKHCPNIPVIAEPAQRDTGPACALATAIAYSENPAATVVILPADHWIPQADIFQADIRAAIDLAANSPCLVTIAIPPTHPSTGFGYLEAGDPVYNHSAFYVRRFVEKPDLTTAKTYLQSGNHFWNAGIFVWRASVFLEEARSSAPALAKFIEEFPRHGKADSTWTSAFTALPKISVDFAVMEKAKSVVAIRSKFKWDDIGTWTALSAHLPADSHSNTAIGDLVAYDSANNIAVSQARTIALCGVQDLIVVETPDAILVCHRHHVQNVKMLTPHIHPSLR